MASELAPELSSMASSLEDLVRRVTAMAETKAGTPEDWVAQELFEVERAVAEAVRRLDSLGRHLRRG
ncbi:MAG: hypothetical protein M3179_06440 [Actinomycetota bacterium]|nr:hypothetical protein [Actinomycetota bacterium]